MEKIREYCHSKILLFRVLIFGQRISRAQHKNTLKTAFICCEFRNRVRRQGDKEARDLSGNLFHRGKRYRKSVEGESRACQVFLLKLKKNTSLSYKPHELPESRQQTLKTHPNMRDLVVSFVRETEPMPFSVFCSLSLAAAGRSPCLS